MDASPQSDRPQMPSGYGVDPTVTSGLLSWEEAVAKLTDARNYWVATTRPDGRPHVVPVWGLWMDGAFYFGTEAESRKGRNLATNPHIVVHLESGDDAVIIEGQAQRVLDQAEWERVLAALEAKYSLPADSLDSSNSADPTDPADPSMAVYVVPPTIAFAWREQDFPGSATRWRFKDGASAD